MERKPYSAGAVKFSFWFMEFRKTVQLLSEGKSFADIKKLNEETNIYGAPTKLRAQQIYSTVTARIKTYAHDPVAYRFLCGHCIQDETDEDALDYNIIGVWLVCHRKYRDWSTEKSYDLAWILEFMQAYHMTIPRYIKRTKFYRKKMKLLLNSLVRDKDQSQEKGQ